MEVLSAAGEGGDERGRELVMRMTEYAFRVLQTSMADFFEAHMGAFETRDDLPEGEHTLEQYESFRRYLEELEHHFEGFAREEGFATTRECFEFIEQAVGDDVLQQKRNMEALSEQIRQIQLKWEGNGPQQRALPPTGAAAGGAEAKPSAAEAKSDDGPLLRTTLEQGPRAAWQDVAATSNDCAKADDKAQGGDGRLEGWGKIDLSAPKAEAKERADDGAWIGGASKGADEAAVQLGSVIEIIGVKAKPELNGSRAKVVAYDAPSERYTIELEETGQPFKLKAKNLQATGEICEATAERARRKADQRAAAAETRGAENAPPVLLFCQPIPLEHLIQSVLSIAEYSTFSILMRMKVKQAEIVRKVEADARQLQVDKSARALQLRDLAEGAAIPAALEDLFLSLRERIVGLTPHRADLARETAAEMNDDAWEDLVRGGAIDGPGKKAMQGLIEFVFAKRLAVLCSPHDQPAINNEHRELLDMSWGSPFIPDVAHRFLKGGHTWLDRIAEQICEATRSMIRAQREAIEAAKREAEGRTEAKGILELQRGGGGDSKGD